MSISIKVIPRPGLPAMPDVNEPICAIGGREGSMLYMSEKIGLPALCSEGSDGNRAWIISKVIEEIDMGNKGRFNDAYMNTLEAWSSHIDDEWAKWEEIISRRTDVDFGYKDRFTYCGHALRDLFRKDLLRFYLYYRAGYIVKFDDLETEDLEWKSNRVANQKGEQV